MVSHTLYGTTTATAGTTTRNHFFQFESESNYSQITKTTDLIIAILIKSLLRMSYIWHFHKIIDN